MAAASTSLFLRQTPVSYLNEPATKPMVADKEIEAFAEFMKHGFVGQVASQPPLAMPALVATCSWEI
ncbi:MAG: hypothetical protein KDA42_01960 [Planctomycetales bacterium]|nr:hypothetical protein [Planctomycetales bacterium]